MMVKNWSIRGMGECTSEFRTFLDGRTDFTFNEIWASLTP